MPPLARNKQAYHSYEILEEFEAGVVLTGPEVKSAKAGEIDLKGSYASLRNEELWLINCHISPYRHAPKSAEANPRRDRRLLLHKHELQSLIGKLQVGGLTLVPLSLYTKAGLIKVGLGLVRGKKKQDKRASIKKREIERDIQRSLRRRE